MGCKNNTIDDFNQALMHKSARAILKAGSTLTPVQNTRKKFYSPPPLLSFCARLRRDNAECNAAKFAHLVLGKDSECSKYKENLDILMP